MIRGHGRLLRMNKKLDGLKSGLISLLFIGLAGCGAGEASRSNAGLAESRSGSDRVSESTLVQSNQLKWANNQAVNQAISSIRRHPLSKDFAVAVTYPYVITGNLSQAELEHWKSRVQRTQSAIKKMYFKKEPSEVVQIWLFKDEASYFQYNQSLWNAKPGTSFGYYLPKQKRMMMNIASGGGTLTHELVHPYIEANFPQSPLWFNEGLAALYEQSYYKDGRVYGAPNWRLRGLQSVIKADSMPSLQSMMMTNNRQFMGANREIFYAQARYLMLYLQSRGLLEKYYRQFEFAVASDPTGIATLLRLTNYQSTAQLEKDWLRYISTLYY